MPVIINEQFYPALPEGLALATRAVFYGDALFETMRSFDGSIPLLGRHWVRLNAGMQALGFDIPDNWNAAFFQREISRVAPANARVRLTVWRSHGGRYAPERNAACFLITAEAMDTGYVDWPSAPYNVGLSEHVRIPVDAYSNFKTLNAARYVAAAREAAANGWDDALVLNSSDRICEATSSNAFWWLGDRLCTVPLSEGCVAGVMRAVVLENCRALGYTVQENSITFAALQQADEIFLTNAVRGIIPVRIFAGQLRTNLKTKRLFDTIKGHMFDIAQ